MIFIITTSSVFQIIYFTKKNNASEETQEYKNKTLKFRGVNYRGQEVYLRL